MKTKHLKMALSFSLLSCTLLIYTNFDFLNFEEQALLPLETVHEASRIGHAKELLGPSKNKLKHAAILDSNQNLNNRIYTEVKKALPVRYKTQAHQVTQVLIQESAKYKMDPVFVMAIIRTESGFNPQALGSFGEIGLMQLKPETAAWVAQKFSIPYVDAQTLLSPQSNIRLGLAYMNFLRKNFDNSVSGYISAYNMGPLNVRRLLAQNIEPAEYSSKVLKNYGRYYDKLVQKNDLLVASN